MIWLLVPAALATRPDDGGLYSFEDEDVLEAVDGPAGLVRVTYSVEGPNVTLLDDEDGTGYPDFAEEVAATAEDVLAVYEAAGFLPPLSEEDMGLAPLGGSYAFDFYLVDFAGVADGQFSRDDCDGDVCSGFMIMENDFSGYGYRSLTEAVQVLTSHELFHAVQAAYNANQPDWMSEGTAVWAEYLYNPAVDDFVYFCDEYLADTERPIDRPPAGVSSFIYSTALFWAFLDERFGHTAMVELQEAMTAYDDEEGVAAFTSVIEANGGALGDEWFRFATWNLGTGQRAGVIESYEFAEELGGVTASEVGDELILDHRFYPLAASYFRVTWDGGPMWWSTAEDPTGLVFALHPVSDGSANGPVGEALATWAPTEAGRVELGDLPEGTYWLLGTFPEVADNSTKVAFCLGSEEVIAACDPVVDTADTGGDTDGDDEPKDDGSCGCASGGAGAGWAALLAGLALTRRRHRPPPR